MSPIVVLAAIAQVGTANLAQGQIHITGVEQQRTVPCEGRAVIVEGADHDLTFTGACASLKLTGTGNTVVIGLKPDATVQVTGSEQTVRWRSERAPKINVTGVDNQVVRQAP